MRAICRVASSFHLAANIVGMRASSSAACRDKLASAVSNGRARVLQPQVRSCELPSAPKHPGLKVEDLEYCTEMDTSNSQAWVPLRIIAPKQQADVKSPAVIFLHPTGSSLHSEQAKMVTYAERGYLTAAIGYIEHRGDNDTAGASYLLPIIGQMGISGQKLRTDCRWHGRRCEGAENPREAYQQAIVRAWRNGGLEHPFLLDNVWDILHLVDILLARDVGRIGITGTSLGGMHAWLAATLDERIHAAAPMIGVQGFKWALDNNAWQGRVESIPSVFSAAAADLGRERVDTEVVRAVWDRVLPGLLDGYDAPHSLPSCAPRPFLIASGEIDPRCPLPGVREAYAAAREKYLELVLLEGVAEADAPAVVSQRLQLYVENGAGHKTTEGMEIAIQDFFDQHLRS